MNLILAKFQKVVKTIYDAQLKNFLCRVNDKTIYYFTTIIDFNLHKFLIIISNLNL